MAWQCSLCDTRHDDDGYTCYVCDRCECDVCSDCVYEIGGKLVCRGCKLPEERDDLYD